MIRTDKEGKLKNSKPCNHCLETMKFFGIKNVYYSTDDGNIQKCKVDELEGDHLSSRQTQYHKYLNKKTGTPLNIETKKQRKRSASPINNHCCIS